MRQIRQLDNHESTGVEFYCDEDGWYHYRIDGKSVCQYEAWLVVENT